MPVYALSSVIETRRRVTLFRGVYPIMFKGARNPERALHMAEDELLKRGAEHRGDSIVLTIGEPFGKAGAYGIQGRAAAFVAHISGSYSGIMGLPLFETAALLALAGITL